MEVQQAAVPRGSRLLLTCQLHGGPGPHCWQVACALEGMTATPPTVSFWFPIHVSWGWGRGGSDIPSGHGLVTQIPPANPTSYESRPRNTAVSSSGRHTAQKRFWKHRFGLRIREEGRFRPSPTSESGFWEARPERTVAHHCNGKQQ